MTERFCSLSRNQRKHFVKCVDCGCQTLPQNAPKERPWAAAATLHISGRIDDGALCFACANKRRVSLGLPIEKEPGSGMPSASACARMAASKRVTINNQEYTWEVTALDSVILKWKEKQLDERFRHVDAAWWLVVVNNRSIPAGDFSSVQVYDGDEISIVLGRGRYF